MDRFSTSLRRRNYNNRGLVRHHFVDDPCRISTNGNLWAFIQRTFKEGLLLYSTNGGFSWNKIYNDATVPSEDLWYHTAPRSVAGTDVQGPIISLELFPDIDGAYIFTGGDTAAGAYTDTFQLASTLNLVAQKAPAFTTIASGDALEGVFATSAYQQWLAIGYVGAGDSYLYVDRFSPYDGSLAGAVPEDTYAYLNRYDMVANGQIGVCDIVIQADVGGGGGGVITYPILKTWSTSRYTKATTCAISKGGTDYNDAFGIAESKHCAYIGGLSIAGTHAPKLIHDPVTNRYIYQCTSVVYSGNTYKDTLPGRPDANYTLFYAGYDGVSVYVYEAGTPSCSEQDLMEPVVLKGYTGAVYEDANITGTGNVDMILVYLAGTPSYRCAVLVSHAKLTEAQNAFISAGFAVVRTILSVYVAGGAGNNYTFAAAAITGAGASLWGGDGCGGIRASANRMTIIGAPSSMFSPEPCAVNNASYLCLGVRGAFADSISVEDVDLILTSFAGKDYSFYCRHSASYHYIALLTTAGYGGFTHVLSVFKSHGRHADYTLQVSQITGAGATLWGGDGCGGERTTSGGGGTAAGLKHVRYDFSTKAFDSPHDISDVTVVSVAIARDGYDNLCAVWGELDGSDVDIKYGISQDNGSTWIISSPAVGGTTTYVDAIRTQPEARVDIIGGQEGGFLFMYVRNNGTANRLYVHHITTTNGTTYVCGDAKEATSRLATENVVGGHFFKPSEDNLLILAIPGFARIAYQIEEGDATHASSELMLDATPVGFGQELLLTAYPVSTPTTETASNQDFYTVPMAGGYTTKYLDSFNSMGTTCLIRQYEPNPAALMADRTAYGAPTEAEKKVMLDPASYGFPTPDIQAVDQTEWIEKDVRKVFLPPDFPLLRTFVLNAGNFLKRTVWTILLDGNEYEISQVVPRFINEQIAFYEANTYVIGPSRDPWSRTVLPSET